MSLQSPSLRLVAKSIFRRTHTLINYKAYPLHDRQSVTYNKLVLNGREQYQSTGCLYLPNFLTQQTLSTVLKEVNTILTNSNETLFQSYIEHTENLYNTSSSKQTNINEVEATSKTIIAYDQIPNESLLRKIYLWDCLTDFVRDITNIYPKLYQSCDEYGALYVNIYRQSNKLGWHTDHSQFFVNLLLQQASNPSEGIFEYKTNSNSQVISRNDFQAGGLVLFNGRSYSHRVTGINSSELPRINAILTYDSTPTHRLSEYIIEKFFRPSKRK